MLPLDIPRALWSPRAVEFLCDGHLVTELSVYFAGKMCATIRGYYAWFFPVSEKELVQTAGSVYCTVPCAWYGSEVSTKAVKDGEDVALSLRVWHGDEVSKD